MSNVDLNELTDRQHDIYTWIRDTILGRGYGPTIREIGANFKINSPNGVMCHLRALEKKGLIVRDANKSRSIQLVREQDRHPDSLPMVGVVAAGPTALAFEQENERINLDEMFYRDDRFILQVSGDSMIEAHIADGDYVVVQRANAAEPGQMVVAQTSDGEATLKYWHPEKKRIRLQPANADMDPIYVKDAQVMGVAVGVIRGL